MLPERNRLDALDVRHRIAREQPLTNCPAEERGQARLFAGPRAGAQVGQARKELTQALGVDGREWTSMPVGELVEIGCIRAAGVLGSIGLR